jgi:hypothetical protein
MNNIYLGFLHSVMFTILISFTVISSFFITKGLEQNFFPVLRDVKIEFVEVLDDNKAMYAFSFDKVRDCTPSDFTWSIEDENGKIRLANVTNLERDSDLGENLGIRPSGETLVLLEVNYGIFYDSNIIEDIVTWSHNCHNLWDLQSSIRFPHFNINYVSE